MTETDEIKRLQATIEQMRADLAASERLRDHATRELDKDAAIVKRLEVENDQLRAVIRRILARRC